MIGSIKALQDTILKKTTAQSSDLPDSQKVNIKSGQILVIKWIDSEELDGHRLINLEKPLKGFNTYYGYIKHFDVVEIHHPKLKEFAVPEYAGEFYTIPGVGKVKPNQPMSDFIKNFTWAEATHNGTRIPAYGNLHGNLTPEKVTSNLLEIFTELQKIRNHYKVPISVTSGYRPPSVNKRVGGASNSQHLFGNAVDFKVAGISPQKVYRWLDPQWNKGGLASSRSFTHIDLRGYRARWSYD